MPGDDLVKRPGLGYTRAITIDASPADVWPWLVQIGQGRGGFYSYDGLENLVGCNVRSANHILANQQTLNPGDLIRSGPDTFPCWVVMDVDAPHHLILLGAGTPANVVVPETVKETPAKDYAVATWQWQLLPVAEGTKTRLVVRQRLVHSPGQRLIWRLVEPINFVMENKMLKGLRARAESEGPAPVERAAPTVYDVTDTAVILHPAEEVYAALVGELSGTTCWWQPHRSTTVRGDRCYDEVGAIADTIVGGRWPVSFTTTTIEARPGELIRVQYVGGAFRGVGTWTFTEIEGGTEVAYRWQTNPSGPLRRAAARMLPVAKTHSTNLRDGFRQLEARLDQDPALRKGSMKAVVRPRYGPPEVLELADIPTPTPAVDEVLVRVRAASVGAWDWHYLAADPHLMRLTTGLRKPRVPVAGIDLAGEVVAVGTAVTRFRPGAEVYGVSEGSFAEYTCTSEDKLAPKPSNLTFAQAAAIPTAGAAALIGLRDSGRLHEGQAVLVIGASGGVGTFATQIAKALGAEVTAVCSTANTGLVRSLGADHVVDYTKDNTSGREQRYDLIFQLAGRDSPLELRTMLTRGGTLVLSSGEGGPWIGPGGRILAALALSPFVRQRLCTFVADPTCEHLVALTDLIEVGAVTPVIDKTFPLSEAADAVRYVRAGHTRGKTVLTV